MVSPVNNMDSLAMGSRVLITSPVINSPMVVSSRTHMARQQVGRRRVSWIRTLRRVWSYIAGWVTGLIFFLMEKQNRFVRFNAMQSIIFFASYSVFLVVVSMLTAVLPFALSGVLSCVSGLVGLGVFVMWIILLVNAFQGKYFKLPIIGDYAERYVREIHLCKQK